MKMKKIAMLAALTAIVVSCKKQSVTQPTSTTTTPAQPSIVDLVVQQNGKAATRNDYKNGVVINQNQQVTISIQKYYDTLRVESRNVYFIDSTATLFRFKGTNSTILGIDSVIYNRLTKQVRYTNDCAGCGQGGANMKIIIVTN